MTRRWRLFWLVPFILLLVSGVERLSMQTPELGQQAADAASLSHTADSAVPNRASNNQTSVRLVRLYPVGDLFVGQFGPEPAEAENSERKEMISATGQPNPAKPISLPSPELDGERPVLEVDYQEIGFDSYLNAIQQVGRFFILIETQEGAGLGPVVTVRENITVWTNSQDMDVLASTRPHLVDDPGIQERLAAIELPANAYEDRLVLMLTRSFDSLLWNRIRASLSDTGLALSEVALVRGVYQEEPNGVFLLLGMAVARTDGREYSLHGKLRVSL